MEENVKKSEEQTSTKSKIKNNDENIYTSNSSAQNTAQFQNQNYYPYGPVQYIQQTIMSVKTIGTWLGLLAGIIGIFIVFAWKTDEDRRDYLNGWIIGMLILILITVVFLIIFMVIGFTSTPTTTLIE